LPGYSAGVSTFPSISALAIASALMLASCALPGAPGGGVSQAPQTVEIQPLEPAPVPNETPQVPIEHGDELAEVWASVAALELRQKLAGLVVASLAGSDPDVFRAFVTENPVAGFLLLGSSVQGTVADTARFVAAVQEGQEYPLLFAIDQEGGPVARMPGDNGPGARELGRGPTQTTTEVFAARQQFLADALVNVNFGVVADLSPGSAAYIHPRVFGSDPAVVSDHVVAALDGSAPRVAQTLKHFPGHGLVFGDSHKEIPTSALPYADWLSTHALPFRAGVDSGVDVVMTAHIRVITVSKDPASLSNEWVDIVRDELGFEGVIITDDLAMLAASGEDAYQDPAATAVAALIAGNDLIMLVADTREHPRYSTYTLVIDALVEAVRSGVVSEDQVDRSLVRVLALRQSLADR